MALLHGSSLEGEAGSPHVFAGLQWGTTAISVMFSFSDMVTALSYFVTVYFLGLCFGSQVKFYCFHPLKISQKFIVTTPGII